MNVHLQMFDKEEWHLYVWYSLTSLFDTHLLNSIYFMHVTLKHLMDVFLNWLPLAVFWLCPTTHHACLGSYIELTILYN